MIKHIVLLIYTAHNKGVTQFWHQ